MDLNLDLSDSRATALRKQRSYDYLRRAQIAVPYANPLPTPRRKRGVWRAHHCQPWYRWNPLLEQELGQGSCICDIPTSESWPDHSWLHQLLAGQVGAEWQAAGVAWKHPWAGGMRPRPAHPAAGLGSAERKDIENSPAIWRADNRLVPIALVKIL